jgi:hypothetical protein
MGDRVSVSFANGDEESVVLFAHWGGMAFAETAKQYADDLCVEMLTLPRIGTWPLSRLEPNTVMVDFIRYCIETGWIHATGRVESNYYFGATDSDGDNSDNGHHRIDLPAVMARMVDLRTKLAVKPAE